MHYLQEIHFRGPGRKKSRKMYSLNRNNTSREAYTYTRQNMDYSKNKTGEGKGSFYDKL